MNQDPTTQVAALRRRAVALRADAELKPHLRHTLEQLIEQLEEEALALEDGARSTVENLA